MNKYQRDAVTVIAWKYRTYKYEHLSVLDQDGYLIYEKKGSKNSVKFGYGRHTRGNVIIHNHPDNNEAFSYQDLIAASVSEARYEVVICKNHSYVITIGDGYHESLRLGIRYDWSQILEAYMRGIGEGSTHKAVEYACRLLGWEFEELGI